MGQHFGEFLVFARNFFHYVYYVRGVLVTLLLLVVLGGVAISYLEGLHLGEAIYFAFVTGLTIGYGDIEPVTPWGRVVSIAIGMVGIMFTGMYIAVATRALADTVKHLKQDNDRVDH